jgi:hypothetical protein
MNNFEIIKNVEQLAHPYFQFEKENVFSAMLGGLLTNEQIENTNVLHFKRNSKKPLSENKKQEIINNIKNLDIGTVEYVRVSWYGYLLNIYPKDKQVF